MMTVVASFESIQKSKTGQGPVVHGVVQTIIADVSEGESCKQGRRVRVADSERKHEIEERGEGYAGQR